MRLGFAIHYGIEYAVYFINRTVECVTATFQPKAHKAAAQAQPTDQLSIFSSTSSSSSSQLLSRNIVSSSANNCPFIDSLLMNRDIVRYITQFLSGENLLHFLSLNTTCRSILINFNRFRVATPTPLALTHGDDIKLQFAEKNNLFIKIQLKTPGDYQNLIDFIKNEHNQHVLELVEAIKFCDIPDLDKEKSQELLNLLAQKGSQMLNLRSFSCGTICYGATLAIPKELINLTSFSCETIGGGATLAIPKELINLTSFSCGNIYVDATLTIPKELINLTSFSCGTIWGGATLAIPKELINLTSFSCGTIWGGTTLILPEMPMLEHLSFNAECIDNPAILNRLLDLQTQIDARAAAKNKQP